MQETKNEVQLRRLDLKQIIYLSDWLIDDRSSNVAWIEGPKNYGGLEKTPHLPHAETSAGYTGKDDYI